MPIDAYKVLAGIVATVLAGCGSNGMNSYSYRMTVEVETPEGLVSGSATRNVKWREGSQLTPEADSAFMAHTGEAVVVALPDGQFLFALPSPDGEETPRHAFGSSRVRSGEDFGVRYLQPPQNSEARYGSSGYPRLVRFENLSDPRSVEAVAPHDFEASFGAGYRLKSIQVQLVDDEPTKGVRDVLPWIDDYQATNFLGTRGQSLDEIRKYGLAAQLGKGSFIQGD